MSQNTISRTLNWRATQREGATKERAARAHGRLTTRREGAAKEMAARAHGRLKEGATKMATRARECTTTDEPVVCNVTVH
jgi:hypothetical protein